MNRIEKIRAKWPDSRLKELPGVTGNLSPDDIFTMAMAADPTRHHKYVDWTLTAWENNGLLLEDIRLGASSKTAETLADFERLKSRIGNPKFDTSNRTAKDRSIMRYKVPGELYRAVKPWIDAELEIGETTSSREQKRLDMMKARLETYSVLTNSGVKVEVPSSQFAATILGRQTKWCTSAAKNNQFDDYSKTGPLIIITLPTGERFQAHSVIFRDNDSDDFDLDAPNDFSDDVYFLTGQRAHMSSPTRDFLDDEERLLESHIIDMDFMNEADMQPTQEEGVALKKYKEDIAASISDIMLKSTRVFQRDDPIQRQAALVIQERTRDILIKKIEEMAEPSSFHMKPNYINTDHQPPKTIPNPTINDALIDRLRASADIITENGREFLNIREAETFEGFMERIDDIIFADAPYLLETVNASGLPVFKRNEIKFEQIIALAQYVYTHVSVRDRDIPKLSDTLDKRNIGEDMATSAILMALMKIEMKKPAPRGAIPYSISTTLPGFQNFPQYVPSIMMTAPKDFMEDYIAWNPGDTSRIVTAYFSRDFPHDFSRLIECRAQAIMDNGLSHSKEGQEAIEEWFVQSLADVAQRNTQFYENKTIEILEQDIKTFSRHYRDITGEDTKPFLIASVGQVIKQFSYDPETISQTIHNLHDAMASELGLQNGKDAIKQLVDALDRQSLTEENRDTINYIIKTHGLLEDYSYEKFPLRFRQAIYMLTNSSEDNISVLPRTTPCCLFYIEAIQDVGSPFYDIAVASNFVSNPSRAFLEKAMQLGESCKMDTPGAREALEMLKIEAMTEEEKANAYTRRTLALVHEAGLIDEGLYNACLAAKPSWESTIQQAAQKHEKHSSKSSPIMEPTA